MENSVIDCERREVARRLRSLRMTVPGVTSLGHGYLWSLLWAVSGDERRYRRDLSR